MTNEGEGIPESLMDMFRNSAKKHLNSIEGTCLNLKDSSFSISESNQETLYHSAHSLKGIAGSFGFPEISELCLQIEEIVITLKTSQNLPESIDKVLNKLGSIKSLLN